MSVYKRGEIWFCDFTVDGERRRVSTGQRSKAGALKVETRLRERAKLGEVSRPDLPLKVAADRWFAARIDGKKSAKTTAQRVQIMLRLMGPETFISAIDTPEIEEAMQARRVEKTRQGRAPTNGTVNRDLIDSTLRPLLIYCRKVLKLQVADIDWRSLKLAEPKGRTRSFSAEELAAWRGALPDHHRPVFDFFARYGVRLGEAFFPLDNFDASGGRVTIRNRKNGLPHSFRLLPADARELAARYGRAKEAGLNTIWFRDTGDGLEEIKWRAFQSASRAALDAAGIADARPVHDLRHHAATAFLRLPGANLKQAQRLLGHESIASTARYAQVDENDVFNTLSHTNVTGAPDDDTLRNEVKPLRPAGTGT